MRSLRNQMRVYQTGLHSRTSSGPPLDNSCIFEALSRPRVGVLTLLNRSYTRRLSMALGSIGRRDEPLYCRDGGIATTANREKEPSPPLAMRGRLSSMV